MNLKQLNLSELRDHFLAAETNPDYFMWLTQDIADDLGVSEAESAACLFSLYQSIICQDKALKGFLLDYAVEFLSVDIINDIV